VHVHTGNHNNYFLIGTILINIFNKGASLHDLKVFLLKRFLRTIPIYYFYLVLYILFFFILKWKEFGNILPYKMLFYPFFLQSFVTPHPDFFGVAWSLAIEEWFYLLFPLFLYLSSRLFSSKNSYLLFRILFFIIICYIVRYLFIEFVYFRYKFSFDSVIRKTSILRLDTICFGVLVSFLKVRYGAFLNQNKFGFLFLGICSLIFWIFIFITKSSDANIFSKYLLLPGVSFSLSLILPYFIFHNFVFNEIVGASITRISLISYSLYLCHSLIWICLIHSINFQFFQPIIPFLLFWIFSYIVAFFSFKYLESPIISFRNRILNKE
jgi:peptidoglycan/LPS O-acetylase OafA/YrhL